MRKFSVSLLAISFFIMSLCGCQTKSSVEPIVQFSADVKIVTDDMQMQATLCTDESVVTVTVISPETLNGLTYRRAKSTLYIEQNGLKCTTVTDYLQSFNPFDVLIDCMLSLKSSELQYVTQEEEYVVYKGIAENGGYSIYVDSHSGYIHKLQPQYTACSFEFSSFDS